ncbi:MAG: hypothetical protein H3C26_00440 [Rhodocyclaceae bacterium]|nr:hypothetical protein [Rhodocyclaceae bacterium]
MTSAINMNGAGAIGALDIRGMDLETAMMAVQSNRANLLEAQLKDQIAQVQAKNDQISKLNEALGLLTKLQSNIPTSANAGDKLTNYLKADDCALEKQINTALKEAGIAPFKPANDGKGGRTQAEEWLPGGITGNATKGELEGVIQELKSKIDSASNSQQMDMLRLQSLSNKRNEAFDLMTNFIKKMQDNRSSIVGNMR